MVHLDPGIVLTQKSCFFFLTNNRANNKVQHRALLLHLAGEDVQEIFETLTDTGAAANYAKAEKASIISFPW